MRHVLYTPSDPSLLEATRQALLHFRTAEAVGGCLREAPAATAGPDDSPMSKLFRAVRTLLPSPHSPDVLLLRARYGWAPEEIDLIRRALLCAASDLESQGPIVGSPETARAVSLAAEHRRALAQQWAAMVGGG